MLSLTRRSVTVDLAAEAGGNVETTEPGKVIRTKNGVTCIGYTDLPGRCAAQSSTLFGNNVANFILSMGDAKEGRYVYFNSHMGNWYDGVFCHRCTRIRRVAPTTNATKRRWRAWSPR